MKLRVLLPAAIVILLLLGLVIWISSPSVAAVSPTPGSADLPADAPIQVLFSQPMQTNLAESHLEIEPETAGLYIWEEEMLTFIPDQPWPSGQTITVTLHSGARASSSPGLPVWSTTTWSFAVSKVLLAYLWPANDLADLYALDPVSGEVIRLTEDAAVHDYTIAADGKNLYYTADLLRGGGVIKRITLTEEETASSAPAETITTCDNAVCRNLTVSPDGRWLAYEQVPDTGEQERIGVWLFNLANGGKQQAGIVGHPGRFPTWSVNGWLAFYDLTDQAYRALHPESGSTVLLPNQTGEPGSWHPDGESFLASEIFDESSQVLINTPSGHMLLYDLQDPGSFQDLTREYYLEDTGGVFSPGGQQIAFTRKYLDPQRWTAGRQLWVMDLNPDQTENSPVRQFTNDPVYNHYSIAWSPDGQHIAYMRFDQAALTQEPELWLVDADGSNPIQLVIGGYAPQWIR